MKSHPFREKFNGGVVTPKLRGHSTAPRGDSTYDDGDNMIPTIYGPISRRGGTRHIVNSNSSGSVGKNSELIKFEYNDDQVYQLEISAKTAGQEFGRMRVYKDESLVLVDDALDADGSAYQTITSSASLGSDPFNIEVADASAYTVGKDVVFDISSSSVGAKELDGKLATIVSLNETTIFSDSFEESSDTILTSHTPTGTGTGWTELININSANAFSVIASTNTVLSPSLNANSGVLYTADTTYNCANYSVKWDAVGVGDGGIINASNTVIGLRIQDANNMYALSYVQGASRFYKCVAGTWTALSGYTYGIPEGSSCEVSVETLTTGNVRLKLYVDGDLKKTQKDKSNVILLAGKAGLGDGGIINSNYDQEMTQIDNFSVICLSGLGIEFAGLPDYTNGAITGTIKEVYEIDLPYSDTDLFYSDGSFIPQLCRSNDVMYIHSANHQTRALVRNGDADWSIEKINHRHGPYQPENSDDQQILVLDEWFTGTDANGDDIQLCICTAHKNNKQVGASSDTGQKDDLDQDVLTDNNIFSPTDSLSEFNGGLPAQTTTTYDTTGVADGTATFTNIGTASESNRQIKVFASGSSYANIDDHRWRYLTIESYISPNVALLSRDGNEPNWDTPANKYSGPPNTIRLSGEQDQRPHRWALGAFSDTTGFPSVTTIHDSRIVSGATTDDPRTLHFSQTGYFSLTEISWETHDRTDLTFGDLGFRASIGAGTASPIHWVASIGGNVAVATSENIGTLGAIDSALGFSGGNISYKGDVYVGSKKIQPLNIENRLVYVSRTGRRLYEIEYSISSNGLVARDLTKLADHITLTGIIQIEWQQEPEGVVWCLLSNGKLVSMTYDPASDVIGWNSHSIGGQNDSDGMYLDGSNSMVRTISSIPSIDLLTEKLWMITDRQTDYGMPDDNDNLTQRITGSVEIMSPLFENYQDIKDARYFDSYLSISSPISEVTVTSSGAITGATPVDGTIVIISSALPSSGYTNEVENQYFKSIGNTLVSMMGNPIDFGQAFSGNLQETSTTFSGLEIFAGKTISVYSDGRELNDQIFYSGTNTLNDGKYGANLVFGYSYDSWIEIDNIETGDMANKTKGRIGVIKRVMFRILSSLGLKYGDSEAKLVLAKFDEDNYLSTFQTLKSDDYTFEWDGEHNTKRRIRIQGDGPFPLTIQGIVAETNTEDLQSGR